jgi:hypothetical protein
MVQCTEIWQVLLRTCIVVTLMYGPVHCLISSSVAASNWPTFATCVMGTPDEPMTCLYGVAAWACCRQNGVVVLLCLIFTVFSATAKAT